MNSKEELLLRRLAENISDSEVELCSLKSTGRKKQQSYGLICLRSAGFVMITAKVTRTTNVGLTPEELNFHLRMTTTQCPTFILIQSHPPGTTRTSMASLRLYKGSQVEDLYYRGTEVAPLDSWPLEAVQWRLLRWKLVE